EILQGCPPAAPPGRRDLCLRLPPILAASPSRSVVLAFASDVDHGAIFGGTLADLALASTGRRRDAWLFEIDGPLPPSELGNGAPATITLDRLRWLSARGFRIVHRDLAQALQSTGPAQMAAYLGTGCFVVAGPCR